MDKAERIIFDPEMDDIDFKDYKYQHLCLTCHKYLYTKQFFRLHHCGKEMIPFALWKTKISIE